MCGGAFGVRFETNKKSDGHVLDSYKTLYSDLVAQLVEYLTKEFDLRRKPSLKNVAIEVNK